MKYKAKKW